MIKKDLKDTSILILGCQREGSDTFLFLRSLFPKKKIGIADKEKKLPDTMQRLVKNDKYVKSHCGPTYLKALNSYDLVIKSPGIPIHIPAIERAIKKGKVTSQTNLFFAYTEGTVIGVTGTKGKSTTASLLYMMLREGKIPCSLVGNIGKPALSLLLKEKKGHTYVYELSAHQLFLLRTSPHIAIILNIFPEHLDYYKTFREYINAKRNIARYQTKDDVLIYNSRNFYTKAIARSSKARTIPLAPRTVKKIIPSSSIPLTGSFYLENISAAIIGATICGVSKKAIRKAIVTFKPLPHRLERIGTFDHISFYNDSLSTTPESTIAALRALKGNVETIFLGGHERGLSFTKLAQEVLDQKVSNVVLFPSTGKKIWNEIERIARKKKTALPRHFFAQDMRTAVALSYAYAKGNKKKNICLLSCASPSFGLFRDYQERGELFAHYVKQFAQNKQ